MSTRRREEGEEEVTDNSFAPGGLEEATRVPSNTPLPPRPSCTPPVATQPLPSRATSPLDSQSTRRPECWTSQDRVAPVMQLNWEQEGIDFTGFAGRARFTSGNQNIVMFYFGQSAASRGSSSRERPQAALTTGMGIGMWAGTGSGNGTFWIVREDTNEILNVNADTPVWLAAGTGSNFNDATGTLPFAQKPTAGNQYVFTAVVLKHRIRILLGTSVLFDGFMPARTDAQLKATVAGNHFGVYGSWRNTSSIDSVSISDVLPSDMV